MSELKVLQAYVWSRLTLARHEERGEGAVAWAIIVSLAVAIALAVGGILIIKARTTANNTPTR